MDGGEGVSDTKERGEALDWDAILAEGARIVASYTTPVTLRQLHYRLVASGFGGYENTISRYTKLGSKTAEARRAGWFPALIDGTRQIEATNSWSSVSEILRACAHSFRLDRTKGQEHQVWVLYEKATLTAQIEAWVGQYGVQRGALRGYSSEPLQAEIWGRMVEDGRPVVVFYVGDLDPEGEDIERNLQARAASAQIVVESSRYPVGIQVSHWQRLTILPEQITSLNLSPNPGKPDSKRAKGFTERHGSLFQVEVEAVDPAVLQQLVTKAVTQRRFFNRAVYKAVLIEEQNDRVRLDELANDED